MHGIIAASPALVTCAIFVAGGLLSYVIRSKAAALEARPAKVRLNRHSSSPT
jgi:hypothetical protein